MNVNEQRDEIRRIAKEMGYAAAAEDTGEVWRLVEKKWTLETMATGDPVEFPERERKFREEVRRVINEKLRGSKP